jgi:drug/metabolite transporter (DMT)-like permease
MLLVPAFAIVAAAIILGEPLGLRQVSAIALTLAGVALAMRKA